MDGHAEAAVVLDVDQIAAHGDHGEDAGDLQVNHAIADRDDRFVRHERGDCRRATWNARRTNVA
jgi:hypothetical protein